jgi:hypothetical protein
MQTSSKLCPNQDLDNTLAARAMGWKILWTGDDPLEFWGWEKPDGEVVLYGSWSPSANIANAFTLANQCISGMVLVQSDTGRWAVASAMTGPAQDGEQDPEIWTGFFECEAWQETPELAICAATLHGLEDE